MKVFVLVATVLLALPHAFAQTMNPNLAEDQIFEQEAGPMSAEEAQELYYPAMSATNDRGAQIIGGIVGGIIGGIIGGNGPGHGGGGHGGGGHGGGHGGGGHGGGGGNGGGGHDNMIQCYARDWRGNTYRAEGFRRNWQNVQWRATNKCERFSHRRCRPLGCQ